MFKKVAVAGASGFVGRALIEALLRDTSVEVVGFSRQARQSAHPRLTWVRCDLFSLKDVHEALTGCDAAYYLVHSMLPSAALSQGHFYDFDLVMADNFARAVKNLKIKKLVYLGGLTPPDDEHLSWHLKSRLEVEETLRDSSPCGVYLRAGLIIGRDGSSFTILRRLVERLPIPLMILPSWTETKMQPIALEDVIRILLRSLFDPAIEGGVYDIGGHTPFSYRELILLAAHVQGMRPWTISLPFIPLFISRFFVSLISGISKSLVYPLVLSLKHTMLVHANRAWPDPADIRTSLESAMKEAMQSTALSSKAEPRHEPIKDVRSVQRLPLPTGLTATDIAMEYFDWLPKKINPLISVKSFVKPDGTPVLTFRSFGLVLLVLEKSLERSTPDRQLLYIRGGLLSKSDHRGRLEFREVLKGQYIMAAIHNYEPSLPWIIYTFTQAKLHLAVMSAFSGHLRRIARQRRQLSKL